MTNTIGRNVPHPAIPERRMTQEAMFPMSCVYKQAGNGPAQLVVPFTLLDILSVGPSDKIRLNKELYLKVSN